MRLSIHETQHTWDSAYMTLSIHDTQYAWHSAYITPSIHNTQFKSALICVIMLSVLRFIYCYAKCHYAQCRYTECRNADLHAFKYQLNKKNMATAKFWILGRFLPKSAPAPTLAVLVIFFYSICQSFCLLILVWIGIHILQPVTDDIDLFCAKIASIS
jgi:hypothetical protein